MSVLTLGSSSPRRLGLLGQVGIVPDSVISPLIDESIIRGESAIDLCCRLSRLKCESIYLSSGSSTDKNYILSADTVVSVGGRILGSALDSSEAESHLRLLSGRSHRVHTSVCICSPSGSYVSRLVGSRVRFCRLDESDIRAYIESNEWRGKAGSYGIQGLAGMFVVRLVGSYTNVVGLPLYETVSLLRGVGYKWDYKK